MYFLHQQVTLISKVTIQMIMHLLIYMQQKILSNYYKNIVVFKAHCFRGPFDSTELQSYRYVDMWYKKISNVSPKTI